MFWLALAAVLLLWAWVTIFAFAVGMLHAATRQPMVPVVPLGPVVVVPLEPDDT